MGMIEDLERRMREAAEAGDFETAALLRDSVLAAPYREEADRLELAGLAAAQRALHAATESAETTPDPPRGAGFR